MKTLAYVVFLSLFLVGCGYFKYNQDNLGEEVLESAIDYETGLDIDFSPATPEHGFSPSHLFPFERVKPKK